MFAKRRETADRHARGHSACRALTAAPLALSCLWLGACGGASGTSTNDPLAAARPSVSPAPSQMTPAQRREIGSIAACLRAHGIKIPPQQRSGSIDMRQVNQHAIRYQAALHICILKLKPEARRQREEARERAKKQ